MRIFCLLLFLLSSCILNQEAPQPTSGDTDVVGLVVIEDSIKDSESVGAFQAGFASKSLGFRIGGQSELYAKRLLSGHLFRPLTPASVAGSLDPDLESREQVTQCKLYTSGERNRETDLLSVGKLAFGLSGVSLYAASEDVDHIYRSTFDPNFPAGTYFVKAEGGPRVPAFSAEFVVPPSISRPKANGVLLGEKELWLKKSEDLKLVWDNIQFTHEKNVMLLDIDVKSKNVALQCVLYEKDVPVDAAGLRLWLIAAARLKDVPPTSQAILSLMRLRSLTGSGNHLEIKFQGSRNHSIAARVDE